jgi:hypothetical protein
MLKMYGAPLCTRIGDLTYELHELKQLEKIDSKSLKYHPPEGSQIRHTRSTIKPKK